MGRASKRKQQEARATRRETIRLAFFLGAFLIAWAARVFALAPAERRLSGPAAQVTRDVLRLLLWVLPVVLYVKIVERKRVATALGLDAPIDLRGMTRAAIVLGVYLVGMLSIDVLVTDRRLMPPWAFGIGYWAFVLPSLVVVAFAEEILFRGFFLLRFAAALGFWKANFATSAAFVAAHWPGWLMYRGLGSGIATDSISIFAVSVMLGYVFRATGSLWPCLVAHLVYDVVVSLIV